MKARSNEELCALAQKGDEDARSLLLEKNYGFICQTAAELYRSMNLGESDLGIEMDDLTQEGSIGLLDAISHFDSSKGIKFLTYAAPSIKNAMTDLVRSAFAQYEQRMTDKKNEFAGIDMQRNVIERWLIGLRGIDLRNVVEGNNGVCRALVHCFDVYRGQRL